MPCRWETPEEETAYTYEVHLESLLCQACSKLSADQISKIKGKFYKFDDLSTWYKRHLMKDIQILYKNIEDNVLLNKFIEFKKVTKNKGFIIYNNKRLDIKEGNIILSDNVHKFKDGFYEENQ